MQLVKNSSHVGLRCSWFKCETDRPGRSRTAHEIFSAIRVETMTMSKNPWTSWKSSNHILNQMKAAFSFAVVDNLAILQLTPGKDI